LIDPKGDFYLYTFYKGRMTVVTYVRASEVLHDERIRSSAPDGSLRPRSIDIMSASRKRALIYQDSTASLAPGSCVKHPGIDTDIALRGLQLQARLDRRLGMRIDRSCLELIH
jgi:hypothetical protein